MTRFTEGKPGGPNAAQLQTRTLEDLRVEDEGSFRHVGLYADLKQLVRRERLTFRILPLDGRASWDRALFLNLTYWRADAGGDVLVDDSIPADVVAHVAWHHLAAKSLPSAAGGKPSAAALFMGEAIASAFDLYLVGRLLGHAPESSFLETQVPAMREVAEEAGMDDGAFEGLLQHVAADPEAAFSDLRALLYDACITLFACGDVDGALAALTRFEPHRFGALLHRYELSNWILYARALAGGDTPPMTVAAAADRVAEVDSHLRDRGALDWLTSHWLLPALA